MTIYLVTGVAGFIGSNIAEYLLDQGEEVIGLDNMSAGFQSNIDVLNAHSNHKNFTFIEGDIQNFETCEKVCKGVDYVLHQAALGSVPRSVELPLLFNSNNVTGTLNMMKAACDAKVKRFVYASSSSVYGDTLELPKIETMPLTPKSPYAISKATNELYARVFAQTYGLPIVGLRYFNVFGKRQNPNSQYAAVIPKFITCFLKNESPTIYGDGEQTRDFTHIKNVIQANLAACQAPSEAFGDVFNIGCGYRISINMLAEKIKSLTNSTASPQYEPERAGDVKDSLASVDKATSVLGLSDFISLDEGLELTVGSYSSN